MIRFFVYSNLKNYLQGGDPSKDIGSVRTFIIGGIAGAASVFGNTPVDVVKTRMQVCCGSEATAINTLKCAIPNGLILAGLPQSFEVFWSRQPILPTFFKESNLTL